MALRLNTILKGHVEAPECYAKIVEVLYTQPRDPDALDGCVTIIVAFYFNEEGRGADVTNHIETREYCHVFAGEDSRQYLYEWLKTQDDFDGAYDIWDDEFTGDASINAEVSESLTGDANLAN